MEINKNLKGAPELTEAAQAVILKDVKKMVEENQEGINFVVQLQTSVE